MYRRNILLFLTDVFEFTGLIYKYFNSLLLGKVDFLLFKRLLHTLTNFIIILFLVTDLFSLISFFTSFDYIIFGLFVTLNISLFLILYLLFFDTTLYRNYPIFRDFLVIFLLALFLLSLFTLFSMLIFKLFSYIAHIFTRINDSRPPEAGPSSNNGQSSGGGNSGGNNGSPGGTDWTSTLFREWSEKKKKKSEYHKKYYEENKERMKEQRKKYREENKEKNKEYHKKWYKEKKDREVKIYKEINKKEISESYKNYYEENKGRILGKRRSWRTAVKKFRLNPKNSNEKKK